MGAVRNVIAIDRQVLLELNIVCYTVTDMTISVILGNQVYISARIISQKWYDIGRHLRLSYIITMTSNERHVVTGHSVVSLSAYADPHQRNIKVRIIGPLWGEFTGDFPTQKPSNAEKASIWWRHNVTTNMVAADLARYGTNTPTRTVLT